MSAKYPTLLSAGQNNQVVALSETEVAKIYTGDTRSDIGSEASKLQFANAVNGLLCKFIRLDYQEDTETAFLVLERLYPLDFRSLERFKRELLYEVFLSDIQQLHKVGFVHRDICRPSSAGGELYDNVLLCANGLRLIDAGISALRSQVGDKLFAKFVELELLELEKFKQYFVNR
jgi:serine/threonine protein kinase